MFIMKFYRFSRVLETALLVLLASFQQSASICTEPESTPEVDQNNGALYAACEIRPCNSLADDLPKIYGQVLFKQDNSQAKVQVIVIVTGFPTGDGPQPRAMHIHQYGDLSQGCNSTGGHYNPLGVDHPNHPGDFGNFTPQQGKISRLIESNATLFGERSVFGRAVVVHQKEDDLGQGGDAGSRLNGNAGRRLACCVIGISPASLWDTQIVQFTRPRRRNSCRHTGQSKRRF